MIRSAIMSIASSRSSSCHSVACGGRYLTRARARAGDQRLGRRALWAEPAARDRGVGIAFDLGDGAVLDVDPLAAPHGAVRADRLHDPVGVAGARMQRRRVTRARGRATGGRIAAALPEQRPAGHEAAELAHPESIVPTRIAGETHAVPRRHGVGTLAGEREVDDHNAPAPTPGVLLLLGRPAPRRCHAFVEEGLEEGEPAMVALPEPSLGSVAFPAPRARGDRLAGRHARGGP